MGDDLDDFGGREMTIAADQDMGRGPMAPEIREEADQDHRIFRARGALPRSEEGGDQGVRGPFENKQRQIAMTLVTDGVSLLQTNKNHSAYRPSCRGHALPPHWLKACNPARNGGVYDHHHRFYHGVVL